MMMNLRSTRPTKVAVARLSLDMTTPCSGATSPPDATVVILRIPLESRSRRADEDENNEDDDDDDDDEEEDGAGGSGDGVEMEDSGGGEAEVVLSRKAGGTCEVAGG
jgi:hypothetical protein